MPPKRIVKGVVEIAEYIAARVLLSGPKILAILSA
jgi:hypothetical protein